MANVYISHIFVSVLVLVGPWCGLAAPLQDNQVNLDEIILLAAKCSAALENTFNNYCGKMGSLLFFPNRCLATAEEFVGYTQLRSWTSILAGEASLLQQVDVAIYQLESLVSVGLGNLLSSQPPSCFEMNKVTVCQGVSGGEYTSTMCHRNRLHDQQLYCHLSRDVLPSLHNLRSKITTIEDDADNSMLFNPLEVTSMTHYVVLDYYSLAVLHYNMENIRAVEHSLVDRYL